MAKVSGPLMSMDARGAFGGALVFSGWKGRATVRQLVIPANPQSTNQQAARNAVRVLGALQVFASHSVLQGSGRSVTDKSLLTTNAPSGQAWNGYLVKGVIGSQRLTYDAARTAYALLTGGNKTTWQAAAAALTPPVPDVAQVDALGVPGTPVDQGEVWYIYQYGLYSMGLAPAPVAGTPPTYA